MTADGNRAVVVEAIVAASSHDADRCLRVLDPCVRLGWQQDFKIVFPARRFPHGSHGLSTRQQRTELGHAIHSG